MIRIITDSSGDLDLEAAAQLQVDVIPIHISFGETEYLDRQNLSVTEFYNKLETVDKLPTTSQITPFQFCQTFQPYLEAGDEIVMILLSSQLSGTYQSALTAKQMLQTDKIYLVDSLNAALGQHLLVQIAVRLREQRFISSANRNAAYRVKSKSVFDCLHENYEISANGWPYFCSYRQNRWNFRYYTNHFTDKRKSRSCRQSARSQNGTPLDGTTFGKGTSR